jgi:hypothetical protein
MLNRHNIQLKENKKMILILTIGVCIALAFLLYKLSYDYADRKIRNNWQSNENFTK